MKNKILSIILLLLPFIGTAQEDSLTVYLKMAIENNPTIKSSFMMYKAALEKIPQAAAYSDLQLEVGAYIKPMETLEGKQFAEFKLMQMFPWFGTRKAARNEATEMARMNYEQFREEKDNLRLLVKTTWYQLQYLNQKRINIEENITLLHSLKELSISRFSSTPLSISSRKEDESVMKGATQSKAMSSSSGMSGMNNTTKITVPAPQKQSMGSMGSNQMNGGSSGGMSDVLRIEIELTELNSEYENVLANIRSTEAMFNSLLNRSIDIKIDVSPLMTKRSFSLENDSAIIKTIIEQNPMLAMVDAEIATNKAKLIMNKRMGLPMFGVGVQYMLNGKSDIMAMGGSHKNGMDMIMPMFSISIPLYRNKYKASEKEAKYLQNAAEEKQKNTQNQLIAQYATIKQELETAERNINLFKKQSELTLSAYKLAVVEFTGGANSLTSILDIERQLLNYKFKYNEAITTFNTVVANLEKLLSEPQL